MADYTRINDFQAGDFIIADQIDDEFNAVATAVNSKPDADGTLQVSLVAQSLGIGSDVYSASATGGSGTIPICNSTRQAQLNADLVDGQHAADFLTNGFPAGTRMVFYQASPPDGWTEFVEDPGNALDYFVLATRKNDTAGDIRRGVNDASQHRWDSSFGYVVTVDGTELTMPQLPLNALFAAISFEGAGATGSGGYRIPLGPGGTYPINPATVGLNHFTGQSHTHTASIERTSDMLPPVRLCLIATKD